MILPKPSTSNEVYVFSRKECALIRIGRHDGMLFVMLRAVMKINIAHVQIHQTSTFSRSRRPSTLNGLRFTRLVFGRHCVPLAPPRVAHRFPSPSPSPVRIKGIWHAWIEGESCYYSCMLRSLIYDCLHTSSKAVSGSAGTPLLWAHALALAC